VDTPTIIGLVADGIGILGAVFALYAAIQAHFIRREQQQERQRQNEKVDVKLNHGGEELELPIELRRADVTRAEVLGRIGMIPMKEQGRRFSLKYLSNPDFLKQIDQIAEGKGENVLTISCNKEEFNQFDLPTYPPPGHGQP
jgi:hypothetical protein